MPEELAVAELRAAELDLGADRVLVTKGIVTEHAYLAALGKSFGLALAALDTTPRAACPLSDDQLIEAATRGLLVLDSKDGPIYVVAPLLVDSRRLVELLSRDSPYRGRIHIASVPQLQRFIARHGGMSISRQAAEGLRSSQPELSAGVHVPLGKEITAMMIAAALAAIIIPDTIVVATQIGLGSIFLCWTALRLIAMCNGRSPSSGARAIADNRLPVYTVIIALYREAAAASKLIAALKELNYPKEKLNVILVLEADDHETPAVLAGFRTELQFDVIISPATGPRTKPKALNIALPFARGSLVAIYDAEDLPEPDQLRCAFEAFDAGDERLACVQARLTIDNTGDSWLTRMFTAEYAGLFDVFLPALAAWHLPLPLGGSSNHFRKSVLQDIGAWDPYNVTEDADLGVRLARRGYRTTMIGSATYEEAPTTAARWLRQRTRWFKGWMQTWLVHMRAPQRLLDELGSDGFIVFQLIVGGTVLAALVHTVFAVQICYGLATVGIRGLMTDPLFAFYTVTLIIGYLVSGALGAMGLRRRRLLGSAWALLYIPIYWVLLSWAAWRAVIQLIRDPYRWEKTEHGLAQTSRLADQAPPTRGGGR
jgi:cellulose synthase/poly-beta-1,6-N-acetylglucosamine synthase-like glycosyltransferase